MNWRLILLGLAAGLAACRAARPAPIVVATPALLPWPASRTPPAGAATTATARPATPVVLASATPTATPVTHVVAEGESLLSIALDYGISVEALQAANPDVQVRFLSIGAVLVIPPPEGAAALSATHLAPPAPLALSLSDPACFPTTTGALYCLIEVANPLESPAENISARVTLAGGDGLPFASEVGFAAVNLLASQGTAPLAVVFQPAPASPIAASVAELLTADPAAASIEAGRALLLDVVEQTGQAAGPRLAVSGRVRNRTAFPAGAAWVTVTAYDVADAVVGFRTLNLPAGLAPGADAPFAIEVTSLGGAVERYAIVAEGRP